MEQNSRTRLLVQSKILITLFKRTKKNEAHLDFKIKEAVLHKTNLCAASSIPPFVSVFNP